MHYKSRALPVATILKIDKAAGIIRDIVILQEGLDKDRGYFTREFLSSLAASGNAQSKGVKCRFGHPTLFSDSLGSFLGRYKNFQIVKDRDGKEKVTADLHLAPIAQKTRVNGQGISMWDYTLEMAENNPDVFGNSIMFEAHVTTEMKEAAGERVSAQVYSLKNFIASDLVDMPAATESLFKSSDTLKEEWNPFLEEHPEIFEALASASELIEEFLTRYKNRDHCVKMA